MQETLKRKRLSAFVLWGIAGFGPGGLIGLLIAWLITETMVRGEEGIAVIFLLEYAMMGALGGVALGIALKQPKKALLLALTGAIGFAIGLIAGKFYGGRYASLIVYDVFQDLLFSELIANAVSGILMGAISGALLSLPLKNGKEIAFLALAGAVGFVISQSLSRLFYSLAFESILTLAIPILIEGVIVGAAFGFALGYLENRKW